MSLFHRSPRFNPIDPLGDGLGDAIARERAEPEHIDLTESVNSHDLEHQWDMIHQDLTKDPLWFHED
ncbi:MAG: hypothetical protein ACTJG2_00195 [Candidatus Saccharimonadales bacterium]